MMEEKVNIDSTGSISFRVPKFYNWKPKEDITVYELALCVPVLVVGVWAAAEIMITSLPETARRHFEQID